MIITEKEKMLRGEWFRCDDPVLGAERERAKQVMRQLNQCDDQKIRSELFASVLGAFSDGCIEPPFYFDYGYNIELGRDFYANHGCVFLDAAPVRIGANVQLGPGVHIYTSNHPLDPENRRQWLEQALPVTVGDNVWIGGGAIICPGVTVGNDAVVAAGAVVVRDVEPGHLVGGNPARIIRNLRKDG